MKEIVLLISLICLTSSCKKTENDNTNLQPTAILTGFNQNFSMMPNLSDAMCRNIQKLKPKILRYPGGTVTHSWNWREGVIETRNSSSVHLISDIKTLTDYTNAQFVFVLDILNKTLGDQIEMLSSIEKLGVSINYIELGNELYAQNESYQTVFPTGKDYAERVTQWIPELKKRFPKSKIAALLLGRQVLASNSRMYNWNRQVVDNTINEVDAYTYHFYINENKTFLDEKAEFIQVTQNAKTGNKEIWITEYGNNQDKTQASYYTELSALADFLESFPNVTIALNHQIVGGTKNKLTEDGNDFVEEGQLFLKRVTQ